MPINADQNHGIDPTFLSMPINANQFRSIPLTTRETVSPAQTLIGIGINATILINIDQHWALIKGVLNIV